LANDWYTKLVLTVLAASVAALAVQGLRGGSEPVVGEGRFRLQILPMGRLMVKIDSETGKTWRARFPDPTVWTEIADSMTDKLDDAPSEAEEDAEADAPTIVVPKPSDAP
jgi:hypothetical protein